jgi:hypothetical protein
MLIKNKQKKREKSVKDHRIYVYGQSNVFTIVTQTNVLNKSWIKFQFINNLYRLGGVMSRVPASSAVERGFESCHVKPETMILVFAVSTQSTRD